MSGVPMSPDDPMTQSGARWCAEHGRWECNAAIDNHHATAIRGMAKCRHHVGRSTAMAKALGEANLLAWSTQAPGAGEAAAVDPGRVVLDQLRVAVLRADLYGELLRWQVEVEEEGGLVGTTHAAGRDGARVETGEQVRGLARLEAEWRDRAVRFAKTAHDMGIAEAQIELQQAQAELVVGAFLGSLRVIPGLVPSVRNDLLRAFLAGLGRGPEVAGELVAGEVAAP